MVADVPEWQKNAMHELRIIQDVLVEELAKCRSLNDSEKALVEQNRYGSGSLDKPTMLAGIRYIIGELQLPFSAAAVEVEAMRRLEAEPKPQPLPMVLMLDSYLQNVERLHNLRPFFYDRNQMHWLWNAETFAWEIIDETDMMVRLDKELQFYGQTIGKGVRGNYMEAVRRVGRQHIPEEPGGEYVQFRGILYNLKTREMKPATPEFFATNPIPWEIGETSETPTMDRLFSDWVGDTWRPTLYEMIAYCCTTLYPIHSIFSLVGIGRNGKSSFIKVLSKFLGKNNLCSADLDQLVEGRFETAKLYRKTACLLNETNYSIVERTSKLKALSSGDLVGIEFKGKNPFDVENTAKLIIATNSLPSAVDGSDGWHRRWVIVDFPNLFEEGKEIVDIIPDSEYRALARKVTEILPELFERGSLTNQGTIEQRKQRYIAASNPLPLFLQLCCDVGKMDRWITFSDLYGNYTSFLSKNKRRVVSRKEFGGALLQEGWRGHRTMKKKEGQGYIYDNYIEGISMKEGWENKIIANIAVIARVPTPPISPISFMGILGNNSNNCNNFDVSTGTPSPDGDNKHPPLTYKQILDRVPSLDDEQFLYESACIILEERTLSGQGWPVDSLVEKFGPTAEGWIKGWKERGEALERPCGVLWKVM